MAQAFHRIGLIIFTAALFNIARADGETSTSMATSLLPADVFTCEDLGYSGATLNQCGYCVNGNTLLQPNFGVDCASTCHQAYIDCFGTCNGQSYIDECSGKCVLESQPGTEVNSNMTDRNNSRVRDCSGLCLLSNEPSTTFKMDSCGVCVAMQPVPAAVNATTNVSQYKDCSGTCYKPATSALMAKNNSDTCHQCVGPHTPSTLNNFKDACGNCKSENIPCSCTKDQLDMCGVCGGQNDSCTTILSAFPAVIPSDTPTTIQVVGVSLKSKYHTICLFIRQDLGADGKDEEKFTAEFHDSHITCDVKMTEGIYKLHIAVSKNENEVMNISNTSLPFIVYSKTASITSMSPTSVIKPGIHENVTVSFIAQSLKRINVVHCLVEFEVAWYNGTAFTFSLTTTSPNITNGLVNCTFPYPGKSSQVNVSVSFDGEKKVAGPFQIKGFAAPPLVTDTYILPEGNDIVFYFNQPINSTSNLTACAAIFTTKTVDNLGVNASCTWVTKAQLIVTLGHIANATAENNGLDLLFRDNVLYSENETFAMAPYNLSFRFVMSDEMPVAVLVGPERVSPCGEFTLDGHQSLGIQSRRTKFVWNVTSTGSLNESTNELNMSIVSFLEDASSRNLASLVIDVKMLDLEVPYNFTLTVSNGANATTQTNSDHLTVIRSLYNIPTVIMEPSVAHYPGFVSIDKSFTLHSYLAMPACQHELYAITYRWSVSSPKVKFDLGQINKDSYTVEPWTLFPRKNITFTVKVTLNDNPNMTSEASVTFDVVSSQVRSVLIGGYQRTVGNASGILVLNASQSYHIDAPHLPLVYRWSCVDQDVNPCYNYDSETNDVLLVPKPVTRSTSLTIPTAKLRPGTVLKFDMQAFSPLNASQMSETRSVLIMVHNGNQPMVSIDSMMVRDTKIQKPEFEDARYLIPPRADVIVIANISHSSPLRQLIWFIPGFLHDLEQFAMNATHASGKFTEATIQIPQRYLVPNGNYQINLTASSENGESGWAVSSFMVLSPVVSCNLKIAEYEAFQMIPVYIEACSASDHNKPLSYQVYFYHKSDLISLSTPQYHLPVDVMGPPSLDKGKDENVFAVRVCDVMKSCWLFNSTAVKVLPAADMHATAEHASLMANIAKLKGDFVACLRRHALYLLAINASYRIKYAVEFESHLAEALLCARRAAEFQCNDTECFSNLFNLMLGIPIKMNSEREFVLNEIISTAVERLDHGNLTLTESGAQDAFLVLEKIYRYNVSDVETAKLVISVEQIIQKIVARGLHPGQTSVLSDSTDSLLVAMHYSFPNDIFTVELLGGNKTVGLELGKDLKTKFESWKCEGENGSLCHGIVFDLQLYPEHLYRPFDVDVNNTVSDIVQVELLNPSTGERFPEESEFSLRLTANYSQMHDNLTYDCHYWDEENKAWSMDGVGTDVVNSTAYFCNSKRLAVVYAVIGTVPKLSAAVIAGIVLGVLAGLAIVAIIAFLAYKKARTKTMRVSMSKGYHPNVQ